MKGLVLKQVILILFLCVPTHLVFSQQAEAKEETNSIGSLNLSSIENAEDNLVIEEVIVSAHAKKGTLRREMFVAQELVYDTFNELNSDDDYDMVCKKEARIGSQIKYKVCKPKIVWSAEFDRWTDGTLEDRMVFAVSHQGKRETRKFVQRQQEIMAEVANTNPALMQLLKVRLALRKAYESRFTQ